MTVDRCRKLREWGMCEDGVQECLRESRESLGYLLDFAEQVAKENYTYQWFLVLHSSIADSRKWYVASLEMSGQISPVQADGAPTREDAVYGLIEKIMEESQ